jgi:hypothetical protein
LPINSSYIRIFLNVCCSICVIIFRCLIIF